MTAGTGARMNAAEAVLAPTLRAGRGGAPALLWRDRSFTYDQVQEGVNRAGNALRALGVEPENRVLMVMSDTPELVFAYLGAMKIGAVAVAANVRASSADLLHMLRDSRAKVLLIEARFLPIYGAIRDEVGHPHRVVVHDAEEGEGSELGRLIAAEPPALAPVMMAPDDMAFWLYTSGTTGAAKAAVHAHRDVLAADAYTGGVLGVKPGDVLFATSKLFFAYALGNCLFASFRLGATTVLYDGWPDARTVADTVRRYRPSVVFSVPTLYRNMIAEGVAAAEPAFRDVRCYVSAGERLPEALWHQWRDATGVEILDGMGTSETIYMLLSNRPGRVRPGSSGTATPGTEVRLADAEGRDVAPGEPGILWARIDSRADRYWNARDKSQEVFHGPWFRTGDMYRVDEDGYWHHQGRFDDMLKISGQWVSPAEIEEVVLAETPCTDAAVVGVPDRDGLPRTALFAVPPSGGFDGAALEAEIRRVVSARLSPYKCPKWVRFVNEIPRTATGKVQRFKLRSEALEGGTPTA
ncbi:MAG TPA: benzoate-CoA ligase family protein [Alphaproteobacteria bacterium]